MRFKKLLLGSAALVSASLSLITAAAAQDWRGGYGYDRGHAYGPSSERSDYGRGADIEPRLQRTAQWIRSLSDRGALDPGEARRAWGMFRDIRGQADDLRRRGYDGWDARRLDARLDRLDQYLREAGQNRRSW